MAKKEKVTYDYTKQKGFKTLEVADPSKRLKKGDKLTSGIEFYLSTDGTIGKLKVKPVAEKQEPLPHTYDGVMTGIYVAPKRDGGITCNFNVSIEKVDTAGEDVTLCEVEEAVHEIFRLIRLKKDGKLQSLIDELTQELEQKTLTPAA